MKPICIIGRGGVRPLIRALQERNVEVQLVQYRLPDYLNIGWGWSGGDINYSIPPSKLWELQQMKHAGLRIVPLVEDYTDAIRLYEACQTLYERNINHQCGTDIKLVGKHEGRKPTQFHSGFWTVAIPKYKEYRVHTWCGTAFRSGTKVNKDSGSYNQPAGVPVWNEDTGWVLTYSHPAPTAALRMAEKATKACGLDFSGVDILEGEDGELYLLETNTAPGLGPNTAIAYAEQIIATAKKW